MTAITYPKTHALRGLMALFAAAILLSAGTSFAQDKPCQPQMEQRYGDASPDLALILEKLSSDQRTPVVGWGDCGASHYNLGRVVEEAVRALDQSRSNTAQHELFLSPAQNLKVSDPKGAFPRRDLIARINAVKSARALMEAKLQPPAGDLAWAAIMADLNAETHALKAWTSLVSKGHIQSKDPLSPASKARDELAATMLMAAAYIDLAHKERPTVLTALAADAASADAFTLLWNRATSALDAAKGVPALGTDDGEIIKAVSAYVPSIKEFFRLSGRSGPDLSALLKAPKSDSAAPPVAEKEDKEPKKPAEIKTLADSKDPKATPKEKEPKADAKQPKESDTATNKVADSKDPKATSKEKDTKAKADDKTAKDDSKDAKEKDAKEEDKDTAKTDDGETPKDDEGADEAEPLPWEGTAGIVRMSFFGVCLLLPWILLLVLWFLKRRGKPAYVRLANRSLAIFTLLLVFESLVVAILAYNESLSFVGQLGWDGIFLIVPLYLFVVALVTITKLDSEGKIAARRIMRGWAKWGGPALVVLSIGYVVSRFIVSALEPFARIIDLVFASIVGLLAAIFMIQLWRAGSKDEGDEGDEGDDDKADVAPEPKDKPPAPEPKPEKKKPAKKKPVAEKKPEPDVAPEPAPKPAPSIPEPAMDDDLSDLDLGENKDAPAGDSEYDGMSDEDFAAAFAALDGDDGGGSDSGKDAPDDRAELYKLLGDK